MLCVRLPEYFDGTLEPEERAAIEAHAQLCDECRTEMAAWRVAHDAIVALHPLADPPSEIQVQRIVHRARRRLELKQPAPRHWLYLGALSTAAAAAAVIFAINVPPKELGSSFGGAGGRAGRGGSGAELSTNEITDAAGDKELVLKVIAGDGPAISSRATGMVLQAPPTRDLLVKLGKHKVAVAEAGGARIVEATADRTVIELLYGTLVLSVSKRHAGQYFAIDTGKYLVEVVGTRFSVTAHENGGLTVGVTEGVVEVVDKVPGGERRQVEAGNILRLGLQKAPPQVMPMPKKQRSRLRDLLSLTKGLRRRAAPKAAPLPEPESKKMREWRSWIEAGNFDAVEMAMQEHFRSAPNDVEAWMLFAEGSRAVGRWKKSVQAYRKVVAYADTRAANEARLEAATLLLEQLGEPAAAQQLLRGYLKTPLRFQTRGPDVMVMLADAERQQGRTDVALELLRTVVIEHKESGAAARARYLLRVWGR